MADEKGADEGSDKAKEGKGKGAKKKRGGKLGLYTILALLLIASPFMMPTAALLLVGMLPTIVALFTDNDRQQSSATAIGAMNFAGVLPFVIDLWVKGQSWESLSHILGESMNWVVMYGAAAMGLMIVFAIPQAIASLTLARAEVRLKILQSNLEQLKTSWGPDVGTTKPLNKMGPT